jgi:hypothetical protein
VPTQINGDRKVARGEMRYLGVPVAMRAAEAMDEHDRWAAFTCDNVVDR